jgi:osmotically-inducible protein OsmY
LTLAALAAVAAAGCASEYDPEHSANSDAAITSEVETKLASYPDFAHDPAIHVETYKGVVQLSGNAITRDDERQAVAIARDVRGVRAVDDAIDVSTSK